MGMDGPKKDTATPSMTHDYPQYASWEKRRGFVYRNVQPEEEMENVSEVPEEHQARSLAARGARKRHRVPSTMELDSGAISPPPIPHELASCIPFLHTVYSFLILNFLS